jgi:hypothetical protein
MTTAPRMPVPAPTLQALVAGVIDYAGLFPPAALPMREAVASYAEYLDAPEAWVLGRFVVPVSRLDELAAEAVRYINSNTGPWRISALAGENVTADVERIRAFDAAPLHARHFLVDTVELRASSREAIEASTRAVGSSLTVYVELPVSDEPRPLLESVKRTGSRAKVRTGGTTADAFPTAAQLARFIVRCAQVGVPFKATAGLHHPLRGDQPLTYASDASSATMFGFLNVFLASAFASVGMEERNVVTLLEERDASSIEFGDDSVRWRGHAIALDRLRGARATLALSFGSCSFREPIDDLRRLALL